jgi:hypothetical protein
MGSGHVFRQQVVMLSDRCQHLSVEPPLALKVVKECLLANALGVGNA